MNKTSCPDSPSPKEGRRPRTATGCTNNSMSYDKAKGMDDETAWDPIAFLRRDTWKTGWMRAESGEL